MENTRCCLKNGQDKGIVSDDQPDDVPPSSTLA
jgi:hypothetical protein